VNAWLLLVLLAVMPAGVVEHDRARFEAITDDVDAVVETAPPLPGMTRPATAAVLLAIAYKESAFDARVDRWEKRGPAGECGLWQIMPAARTPCRHDRRADAAHALELVRASFAACSRNAPDERLAVYTSGACDRGLEASRERLGLARTWLAAHPPPRSGS
jgi:hypothetical protein